MIFKHPQATLLVAAGALTALFAVGLAAMLLASKDLIAPERLADFVMPMQMALAAFGALFMVAALTLALRGRRGAR